MDNNIRIMQTFSNNLSKYMKEYGMNQDDIARLTGVSQQSVSNWINCKQIPRMGIIETLAAHFDILKSDLLESSNAKARPVTGIRIPILGIVPCGVPIEAIEDVIDYEEISEKMYRSGKFFGLIAKGDSMAPKIEHGDTLIIRQQSSIDSGQIAIVKVNGDEATCKKVIIHDEEGLTLVPLNPLFNTVDFNNEQIELLPVTIIGRVVEIRRTL